VTPTDDNAVGWELKLLQLYPTDERTAGAHLASLEKIREYCVNTGIAGLHEPEA
jgi:hypothetical protein